MKFALIFLILISLSIVGCSTARTRNNLTAVTGEKWVKVSEEGKVWASSAVAADDGTVYITDLTLASRWPQKDNPQGTIYRYNPADNLTRKYLEPSKFASGLNIDKDGQLILVEGSASSTGPREVVRRNLKSGEAKTLARGFQGKRFVGPDDLVSDSQGRIYFTDSRQFVEGPSDLPNSVYRLDPDGSVNLLVKNLYRPNGIALSPDEKKIYISTNSVSYLPSNPVGPNTDDFAIMAGGIVVFDLSSNGEVSNPQVFYRDDTMMVDGLKVDTGGRVYAAIHNADMETPLNDIVVIEPSSHILEHLPLPDGNLATNLAFGKGFDSDGLYATAAPWKLFRLKTTRRGYFPVTKSEGK